MKELGLRGFISFRKKNTSTLKSFSTQGNCLKWVDNPYDYLLTLTPITIQQADGQHYVGYFENAITNLGKYRLPERNNFQFPRIMIQGFITHDGNLECILTDHMGERFFVKDKDSLFKAITTIEKATENRNIELTDDELSSLSLRIVDNHIYSKETLIYQGFEALARVVLSKISKPLYERRIAEEKLFFPDLRVSYTKLKEERLKLDLMRKAKEDGMKKEAYQVVNSNRR